MILCFAASLPLGVGAGKAARRGYRQVARWLSLLSVPNKNSHSRSDQRSLEPNVLSLQNSCVNVDWFW